MSWAQRAKKILECPKAQTDITDTRGVTGTSVGYVGATSDVFSEKQEQGTAEAVPFCDPTERKWLSEYKVMDDLADCGGYPRRCGQCRLSMLSGECLLAPEVDAA